MPVPSPRNSIRIARGNYADLAANATEIGEGELCFAIDQDKFYSKSGGSLVAVGGGTELYSIQQLGDVDVTGVVNGQVLSWNGTTWVPSSTSGAPVDSVNGKTGEVVLVVSDLANDANYITAAEAPVQISDIPTNNNQLLNGAGYITSAEAPVQPGDVFSGDYNDLTNKPTIPPAYDDTALAARVTTNEGDISQLQTDLDNINSFSGDYNDLSNKPAIPANTSDLVNDSGFITAAEAPVQPGDVFSGDYNDLTNKPSIPPAFDGGEINSSITSPEETISGTWDLSAGNFWYCSGGITVPNPTNAVAGMSGLIRLTAAPIGWGSNIKHPGGSAETIANFPAMVPFYVQDASTILLGKATQGIA